MNTLSIFDTLVHEERVFSHYLYYLKKVVTHVTYIENTTLVFMFLFEGMDDVLHGMNL